MLTFLEARCYKLKVGCHNLFLLKCSLKKVIRADSSFYFMGSDGLGTGVFSMIPAAAAVAASKAAATTLAINEQQNWPETAWN